ncbi:MAG: NAD(P)H-binding protein [Kofleriaceae bacterium]|nr:NAD(P)H-binding protein [Kofleriaceae bacterium]
MTKLLVTGSTGTIGRELMKALAGTAGLDVRVGLRDPRKAARGTSAVRLDWEDSTTFAPALDGIERLFLLTPFVEQFERPSRALLEAAARAGVKYVVKLSARGLTEDVPFDSGRQHARLERAVRESGMAWAFLQPTFFMDNVLTFQRLTVLEQGAFYGASGGQAVSYVSSKDVAEVAATLLARPETYAGRAYELTGGQAVTDADIARWLGAKLGREVRFVDLPLEQYRAGLEQQGVPAWQLEALVGLEDVKRQGWASDTTSTVRELLGRAPETFEAFLSRRGPDLG